ncbi:MAG TPA: hypothetical protein VJ224_06700 [Thermoplasmata archaeon]|nr:hypothetical protein [Thermoplasmata archaeon]
MVQPPPPFDPRMFRPSQARPMGSLVAVLAIVLAVLIFIIVVASFFVGGPFGLLSVFPAFFCAFFILVIVLIVVGALGQTSARRIPPPPPIQQPLVPAGQQGPVELACPNCGGPPQFVDRFGIATCAYCGTRFLVR